MWRRPKQEPLRLKNDVFSIIRRQSYYRKILLTVFFLIGFVFPTFLVISLESLFSPTLPEHGPVKTTGTSFAQLSDSVDAEPDIANWWQTLNAVRENVFINTECASFRARQGMSLSILPACQQSGEASVKKPPCTERELNTFLESGGSTKAHCVTRGFQKKCYVENIIFNNGSFFTFKGSSSGVPSKMFVADGATVPLRRRHKYYGTHVREIAPQKEHQPSILNYCTYVVNRPTVFIFRMSGHSTYHLWENNLGPFFSTLHDGFGIPNGKKGDKKRSHKGGVFDGQVPLIITVDKKPSEGPKAPRLLDELLHYFTNMPILDASELTEATCFAKAVIGISSSRFDQGMLRRWLFPRIALRFRFMQLHREKFPSVSDQSVAPHANMQRKTALRCIAPTDAEETLPPVIHQWFAWKLRQWRRRPAHPSVLYLSRNHPNIVRGRKVVNEADVLPALEATVLQQTGKPLRRMFLEEMPYIDQIMTLSETNILIAPHGGGIANCIWMPPGSIVVEFVAPAGATLPKMYHEMCCRSDGYGNQRSIHMPFVAERDPAELEPGFAAANAFWRSNKRLFSNIWLPKEKFMKHIHRALQLYQAASAS